MGERETLEVLNSLIEINNDRIEGYKTASKETKQTDLKNLFFEFENISRECKAYLQKEEEKLNVEVADGTTASGKVFSVWMDLKSAVTDNDRKAILNSCQYGEEAAQRTYSNVLGNHKAELDPKIKRLIFGQKAILGSNLFRIKGLLEILETG